jgi:flagella basal body P-ring formation protein FlgA
VFSSLDPQVAILPSPRPGVERHLTAADLLRIAHQFGMLPGTFDRNIPFPCFRAAATYLDESSVTEAVRSHVTLLGFSDARIRVLEWSRSPVPKGSLSLVGHPVHSANDGLALLHGAVTGSDRRSTPVWIRAIIQVPVERWIARSALPARTVLQEDQLEQAIVWEPIGRATANEASHGLVGCELRRDVVAGSTITAAMVDQPIEARSGMPVELRIQSGATRLRVTAIAASDARRGQRVRLKMPGTKEELVGQLTGPQTAEIRTGGANE